MSTVFVRRRVRPIRIAFLVSHRNTGDFRKAIQVNTVLWGGIFNPIIPVFGRTPASWRTQRNARDLLQGHLDAFEPDFVVVGAGIARERLGVPQERVFDLDAMLTRRGLGERGMGVMAIYQWRYNREFRFKHRTPVALHHPSTSRPLQAWAKAVFGEYPDGELAHYRDAYRDLGGRATALTATTYFKALRRTISPLVLGYSTLEALDSSGPRRAYLVLDPQSLSDLIDFWNLRALGWNIISVPVQWTELLAAQIAKTIHEEHQPDSVLPPPFTRATILKSRSVNESDLQTFLRAIAPAPNTFVVQDWLPRFWDLETRDFDRANRIKISACEAEQEVQVHDDRISFKTIGPAFAPRSWIERARFANVVEMHSFDLSTLASILPRSLTDLDHLLRWNGSTNMTRNSSEGLTVLTDAAEREVVWRIPHGQHVFKEWIKPKGDIKLSSAGKIANRMLSLLGGPEYAGLVTNVELVNMFATATRTASRDIRHGELLGLFMKMSGNRADVAERQIEAMLRRRIIRLGMRLDCVQCAQQNWFSLEELRDRLTCQWCLDELRFPAAMPPKQPCWSYRPLGPFGASGKAQGAYVVAAALKTLRGLELPPRTTWIPSFSLSTASREVEADFGLLWDGAEPRRFGPQLILGECKTFDRFEAKDTARMKHLATIFPGAVLVFATFNRTLQSREQQLIGGLAEWGRRSAWRTPVIVLTARELTSVFGFPFCWHHEGTDTEKQMYEQAIVRAPAPRISFRRLADATQQIHLAFKPSAEWPHYDAP